MDNSRTTLPSSGRRSVVETLPSDSDRTTSTRLSGVQRASRLTQSRRPTSSRSAVPSAAAIWSVVSGAVYLEPPPKYR